jgi:serine protease Do
MLQEMKKLTSMFTVVLIACIALSSCVSLVGRNREVHIRSYPTGADIYRDDGKYVGQTPFVYKGKAHHNFYLTKKGYEDANLYTDSKFNPLYLANIVFIPYGFLEFNNMMTFKKKESYYDVTLKAKPTPIVTPPLAVTTPPRVPTLLETIAGNNDSYTCTNALSKIKPRYSDLTARTPMKGSEVFKKYSNAVFMIFGATNNANQIWQGSGFIVSPEGIAVSNYHNFEDAQEIAIKFYGSESFYDISKDDILAYSKNEDYIIFKVKGRSGFPYIPIANRRSEIGDKVYTIGSPKGFENTFSSGEISQYRTEQGYIQITAPIDHGSSGGVLINEYGEAIGITSAGREDSGANLNFCRDLLYIMNRYR